MAAVVAAMAQGCGGNDKPEDELESLIIGKVGDYVITARDVDLRVRNEYEWLADEFRTGTEQQIRSILQRDLDALCLVAEAERTGFPDTSTNFKHKMEEGRRNTIRSLYSEEVLRERARPSEEELRAEYEANLERWMQPERRVARHILVKTRAEAEEAMSFVEQGEPFAETAKRMTLDETSRINGGSVGFVERDKPVRGIGPLPEFVDAVFDLDVREMRIIQTSMGWHLIRLERMFEAGYTPFEEAKEELEARMLKQRSVTQLQNTLQELRVRYGARLYDENLTKYFQMRRRRPEEELFARAQAEGIPTNGSRCTRSSCTSFRRAPTRARRGS